MPMQQNILFRTSSHVEKLTFNHLTRRYGWKKLREGHPRERRPSILERLPPELVLCITDFLEKPGTVCFSLCSHYLLNVIGKPRLPEGDRQLKTSVLVRIADDLPDMFCCHTCAKLHPTKDVLHPAVLTLKRSTCPEIETLARYPFPPSLSLHFRAGTIYYFRHCHLATVMKSHHHAHSKEVMDWSDFGPVKTTLVSVVARICGSPCCRSMAKYTRSIIKNRDSNSALEHLACPVCNTEFQLKARDCGAEGRAFVLTTWLDLGAGSDIDDPKWKHAMCGNETSVWRCKAIASSREILQLFESVSQGTNSDPTDRNQSCLLTKKYGRFIENQDSL
ncbi:hypothetical protein BJX70DRAFT_388299 [Aspergillus crustosus]